MRAGVAYLLIALNIAVLIATVLVALYVASLRKDVGAAAEGLQQTVVSQNVGCKRGNVSRDAMRFILEARVHDSDLIADTSTNPPIAAYFKSQASDAKMKLDALVDAASLTFPQKNDRFLIDCDKSFPLP